MNEFHFYLEVEADGNKNSAQIYFVDLALIRVDIHRIQTDFNGHKRLKSIFLFWLWENHHKNKKNIKKPVSRIVWHRIQVVTFSG